MNTRRKSNKLFKCHKYLSKVVTYLKCFKYPINEIVCRVLPKLKRIALFRMLIVHNQVIESIAARRTVMHLPHFICQNSIDAILIERNHPIQTSYLIIAHFAAFDIPGRFFKSEYRCMWCNILFGKQFFILFLFSFSMTMTDFRFRKKHNLRKVYHFLRVICNKCKNTNSAASVGSLFFFGRPTVFALFGDFGPVFVMKCVKISVCLSK